MGINDILKLTSSGILTYFLYAKVSKTDKKLIIFIVFSAIYISSNILLKSYISEPYKSIFVVLLLCLLIRITTKESKKFDLFLNISLSVSLCHLTYLCSFLIATLLSGVIGIYEKTIAVTIAVVLQITLVLILIRKLRITDYYKRAIGGLGLFFSGIVLILYGLIREQIIFFKEPIKLILAIVLCFVGIIYWLKRENTIAVNHNSMIGLMKQKTGDLIKYAKDNKNLSSQVHEDKHKILAYQKAVKLIAKRSEDVQLREDSLKIINEFDALREVDSNKSEKELFGDIPKTGFILLDAILIYMSERAKDLGIDLKILINGDFKNAVKYIPIKDYETLVTYLLDNAFIACKDSDIKEVLLELSEDSIAVSDSGILFEQETLEKLGKEKTTTHKDKGGSGIGYMEIFKIVDKINGSIEINQNYNQEPYTKTIFIKLIKGEQSWMKNMNMNF